MYCETEPPKDKEEAEARAKLPASQRKCDGPVKPDITFFGEALPERFMDIFESLPEQKIDLMIVIGTALAVNPFCQVVNMVNCPQVLINMDNTATAGFDFLDPENHPMRIFLQGKCDETIANIVNHCGWEQELN